MNYKERKRREDFLNEIRAIEQKYGLRLAWYLPPIQSVIQPTVRPVPDAARKAIKRIVDELEPKQPWYRHFFKRDEDRKTNQVQP